MAQPIVNYDGNYITCYPGSNQKDDGKLNLEFNMARIVTRLSSKNFCIVKPSYELSIVADIATGAPRIRVGTGQCSINGMDLIMTTTLDIEPPEAEGDYYLAFKLTRDSSDNVLGDLVVGVTTTFEGVYLSYFDEKPDPIDPDMLYLGKVHWDGNNFSDLIEDEDKYGRIWAEDILCKINDPKHPDITRLTLQEWIYKVPDWYVSKEGDVEYGAIEFLPGRDGNNKAGITIQSTDNDNAHIIVKAPSTDESNTNKILEILGNVAGSEIHLGASVIKSTEDDLYDLVISSVNNINVESMMSAKLSGDTSSKLQSVNAELILTPDNKIELKNDSFPNVVFNAKINDANNLVMTVGKAQFSYSAETQNLSLLQTNVNNFNVVPNTNFSNNVAVVDHLYIGALNTSNTYLSKQDWKITNDNGKYTTFDGGSINLYNPNLSATDNSILTLRNINDTIHTKLFDDGKIELLNNARNPQVLFKDGNVTYDVTLEKIRNQKKLNLDGDLDVINLTATGGISGNGLTTTNGILTFVRGTNNATITKDNNSSALRTNGNLYVGSSGTSALYAGNSTIKGTLTTGNSGQFKVDANGNLNTSGTITGSKVYNACYNDIVEFMEKEDYNEIIEAGDIVYFTDNGKVTKYKEGINQNAIAGVVSSEETYGYALGGEGLKDNEKVPVGLKGRVYVKTDNTMIHAGDYISVDACGCVYNSGEVYDARYTLGIATKIESGGKVLILLK